MSRPGSSARAVEFEPFDLVVCDPPYVPHGPNADSPNAAPQSGPARASNAGADGRLVLDLSGPSPTCSPRRRLLVVQSESPTRVAHPDRIVPALGFDAKVVAGDRFRSDLCCRHGPSGWRGSVGSVAVEHDEQLLMIRANER